MDNYEQKYKNALSWMQSLYKGLHGKTKEEAETYFPELCESDDERIRKNIISWLKNMESQTIPINEYNSAIAWLEKRGENPTTLPKWKYKKDHTPLLRDSLILNKYGCVAKSPSGALVSDVWVIGYDELAKLPKEEFGKQGEQKPADKVESKFHEGEWLCENEPNNYARFIQILEIVNVQGKDRYRISRDIHKDEDVVEFGFVEKYYHKFDIKDAKDGDVLATEGFVFIFKEIREDKGVGYFCANENELHEGDDCTFHIANPNSLMGSINNGFTHYAPATKEQRDQLEKAMADAGYTFDFEKKELKKIEQTPAWSEEDESWFKELELMALSFSNDDSYRKKFFDWLKSFKDRVQPQPKQEWSKEDNDKIYQILAIIDDYRRFYTIKPSLRKALLKDLDNIEAWLKSLRPQNTWKPSDKQLDALHDAAVYVDKSMFPHPKGILMKLYKQLKKLREE